MREAQRPKYLFSFFYGIGIPVLLFILFTPFSGWLDLKVSRAFFENGKFPSNPFWDWFFVYGIWPAWLMNGAAAAGFILSFFKKFMNWRYPCLYLILTFAIGSGLIVHAGFKDNWGRPRPRQITEFGGKQEFRPYFSPNFSNRTELMKSFSCGHCSLGFTFFSLALLGTYYQSRFFAWLGWILAWGLGILLSLSRIAQGGHFLSDTLGTALIMWMIAWGLAYLFIVNKGWDHERADP